MASSFESTVNQIIRHRMANPRFGDQWSLDPSVVAQELHTFTCTRLAEDYGATTADAFCKMGGDLLGKSSAPGQAASGQEHRENGVVARLVAAAGRISEGVDILTGWLGDGASPVAPQDAERRAEVCSSCPHNRKASKPLTGPVAAAIRKGVEMKSGASLHTSHDAKLETCQLCSCVLQLKVWVPIRHIMDGSTIQMPEFCWVSKESQSVSGKHLENQASMTQYVNGRYLHEPEPITTQAGWEAGIFPLSSMDGELWFNPGCIRDPQGRLWISARRMTYPKYRATIYFCRVSEDMTRIEEMRQIDYKETFAGEHFEDARCIPIPGVSDRFLVAASNFYLSSFQHQAAFEVQWGTFKVVRQIRIPFGKNGGRIDLQKGMEKNWQFFYHDGRLHFSYLLHPSHIVAETEGPVVTRSWAGRGVHWEFGTPFGGTPPVVGPDGNLWTFFHSHQLYHENLRRYFMGVAVFEPRPPWNVVRMTRMPILAATKAHPVTLWHHLVVFPMGSEFNPVSNQWLVTLGVNDIACAWMRIPHAQLLQTISNNPQ
jgi:hypothetical protein